MPEKDIFLNLYYQANKNASELLIEAKLLHQHKKYARAYFLTYSCLEEIAKGQYAGDVFTGLVTKGQFESFYLNHKAKNLHMSWMHSDATSSPYNNKWIGPDKDDIEILDPEEPLFKKRQLALYTDVDFNTQKIFVPEDNISESDSEEIIHIAETAFHRIWEVTEYWGHQIGTKGFMK